MPNATFWDVQVYAVNALAKLGFRFGLYDRIPIFKTWLKLNKLEYKRGISSQTVQESREGLMGLLQFKHAGMEPPFKGKKYAKDVNGQ